MKVIDTNVISAFMSKKVDVVITDWLRGQKIDDFYTTSICLAEIQYGIMRLTNGAKKEHLMSSLALIEKHFFQHRILLFDREAAYYYAFIANESRKAGVNCGNEDLQIAAICKQHDAHLITRNTKDFIHLGISLIDPWQGN